MEPVKFKQANIAYTKPSNMTDEQCGTLPVYRGMMQYDGYSLAVCLSKWMPTPWEKEAIANGEGVYLEISVPQQPVCRVFVGDPFAPPPIKLELSAAAQRDELEARFEKLQCPKEVFERVFFDLGKANGLKQTDADALTNLGLELCEFIAVQLEQARIAGAAEIAEHYRV